MLDKESPNSSLWLGAKKGSQDKLATFAKKKGVVVIEESAILPLRQCNFYGMVVPCAGGCGYSCKVKEVPSVRLWIPQRAQLGLENLNESIREEHRKKNPKHFEANYLKDWVSGLRCARNDLFKPNAFEAILKPRFQFLGKSMTCLYDHGFPSYLDYWDDMTSEAKSRILDWYDGALPTTENGILFARKFVTEPVSRLEMLPSSWPVHVGINSNNTLMFNRIHDILSNMSKNVNEDLQERVSAHNKRFNRYIGWVDKEAGEN